MRKGGIVYANLFIPGMPRGGTTSLAAWLNSHPDIALSKPKEPGFFAQDLRMRTFEQSAVAYAGAFSGAESARFRLDATPWYLLSAEAAARIAESVPEARFVILLRNPADQVVSMHRHHVKVGFEREVDLIRAISNPPAPDPADFRIGLDYLAVARIGEQIQRLVRHVDHRQVQFVDFDDLRSDPGTVYRALLEWLSLPLVEPISYDRHNPGMVARSQLLHRWLLAGRRESMPRVVRAASFRLSRANLRPSEGPVPDHVRRWLLRQLEPDMQLLEHVLDRSFDHWRVPAPARQ